MTTTTACSINVTAVMCLLWMVFLSASATRTSKERNFAEEEAAFEQLGTFADGEEILSREGRFAAFGEYVELMTTKFDAIYWNLAPKLYCGNLLLDEKDLKDLKDMQKFVNNERLPWETRKFPAAHRLPDPRLHGQQRSVYHFYRHILKKCREFLQHANHLGYTSHLHESPMDSAPQGITNNGNVDPDVSSRVAEPTASTQQWPPVTTDGDAEMSYGRHYADGLPFASIPAYTDDYSSIHETSRLAHPLAPYDYAGPSSSYAGSGTPHTFPTSDPPSGYDPSGSRRLKRRSA
ncbi:hypothetical protein SeLEV6574_g07750, partial [Synchytrium endobioticum]